MGRLDDVDLSLALSAAEEAERLGALGRRLLRLRLASAGLIGSGRLGPPLCVLLERWDASGKGGAIRRLVAPLDPRHVRVAQFAAPSPDEARRHFLDRFVPALPGRGGMAVLDRSWYEDWRNRSRRAAYAEAVEEMLERTSASSAPWHVVAAESKRHARVEVVRIVADALEDGLRRADVPVPAAG